MQARGRENAKKGLNTCMYEKKVVPLQKNVIDNRKICVLWFWEQHGPIEAD